MKRHHRRNSIITFILTVLIIVSGSAITTTVEASAPIYSSTTYTFEQETALIHHVKVDLNDPSISVIPQGANGNLPRYDPNDSEPYWNSLQDSRQDLLGMYNYPSIAGEIAAINTDYFCREEPDDGIEQCVGDDGAPQGLFVKNGRKYQWPGNRRAALFFDDSTTASIMSIKGDINTVGIEDAVSGGPIILQGGNTECNPDGEELIPSEKCNGFTQRSGACISSDGKTLWLMATRNEITWELFADFMLSLGCDDGMEFDGGGSAGLVYDGSYKATPDSLIGTALIVTYNPPCTVLPCPNDTDS